MSAETIPEPTTGNSSAPSRALWARVARLVRPQSTHDQRGASRPGEAERFVTPALASGDFDVAAAERTHALMERYRAANPLERAQLIDGTLAAVARVGAREGDSEAGAAERFFKRINAQSGGLAFLVALRAELLQSAAQKPGASTFKSQLRQLLGSWFDVGLLELRRLDWNSPASILEKLMTHEAVHPMGSWNDLHHRLEGDHQVYALFHPSLPGEPLIFVEVVLAEDLADDLSAVLDAQHKQLDPARARWANFYSISNAQDGLRGISFGNYFLKRVMSELAGRYPDLKGFATLSPIPGLRAWIEGLGSADLERMLGGGRGPALVAALDASDLAREDESGVGAAAGAGHRLAQVIERSLATGAEPSAVMRDAAKRLAAHYLTARTARNAPIDPVARFHLSNGARIERLNWAADRSTAGLRASLGLMVNYRYVLNELDANSARLARAAPRLSTAVARLI